MRREKRNPRAEENWKDRNDVTRDKLLRVKRRRQLPASHQPSTPHAARRQQLDDLTRTLSGERDARVKHSQIAPSEHPRWSIRRGPSTELERKLIRMATQQKCIDRRR